MRTGKPFSFRLTSFLLFLMLAGFVVLSVDVLVRIWLMRSRLESGVDAAVLLSYESTRALTTAGALALAAVSYRHATAAARRAFTLLLLFLALWYTKTSAYAAFPGHLQEALADWLLEREVPRRALVLAFGAPAWAAWLALGALLRLSVTFPRPLEAAVLARSGLHDRAGLLRGRSLAGVDVGAMARRCAAALLQRGAFGDIPVWVTTGAGGLLQALTFSAAVQAPLVAAFALLLVLGLTNLRAATMAAGPEARRRALWMLQATLTAASAFAACGLLSLAGDGPTAVVSLALSALAPPVVLMGVALGITRRHPPDPRPAIRRTMLIGLATAAMAALFVVFASVARSLSGAGPADVVALVAAGLTATALRSRIRALAGRLDASLVAAS